MMKRILMATAVAAGLTGCQAAFDPAKIPDATPEEVTRVEPLSWWTGMKTDLQLLVQGPGIGAYTVSVEGKGLKIKDVHQADNPNFLFVDVEVSPKAKPGTYTLVFMSSAIPMRLRPASRVPPTGKASRRPT